MKQIHQLQYQQQFPGLEGVNIFASEYPIEPFLVFTEYFMDRQVLGPHPHAGISVMTYLLPDSKESFVNRDSNGDFSIIDPGGLHITQAGKGIHHDEFPKTPGMETHGFQIWINHSAENRMVEPLAIHAMVADIPEVVTSDYKVRVLHGSFGNVFPSYKMVTSVTLLHITLMPGKNIELNADEMAFCYVLNGNGTTDAHPVSGQNLIIYETGGNSISIEANENGLDFMYGTAVPLKEQITYGGPFVMTTAEQMAATKKWHAQGKMGSLLSYAQ